MKAVGVLTLALLMTAGPVSAYTAPGPRWPGRTITFHETLPAYYDWPLKMAVKSWNRSGAKVRFRKIKSRSRADVKVGYGRVDGSYSGWATIGHQRAARVLIKRPPKQSRKDPSGILFAAMLLTHEFGHVLGLDHTAAGTPTDCRIMEATIAYGCSEMQQGSYPCELLAADDIRGVVKLYGGKARKPRKGRCLMEPKPPAPTGVRLEGGATTDSPLTVRWATTGAVRPGSKVEVSVYRSENACTDESARRYLNGDSVAYSAGRWVEPADSERTAGRLCVGVAIVNKWGLAGPAVWQELIRTPAAVAAPVITALEENVYDELGYFYDYAVTAVIPQDSSLLVASAASGNCLTTFSWEQSLSAFWDDVTGRWLLTWVPEGPQCLSFFAESPEGGISPATTREVVHTIPTP